MRRDQRKALYRRKRDSLEGPHEEAEIQRRALRRGDNLAFSLIYMFRKGKSAVEGDPKKSWSGIETEAGAQSEEVGLEVSLVGIHQKKEASHLLGLRRRRQCSDQPST